MHQSRKLCEGREDEPVLKKQVDTLDPPQNIARPPQAWIPAGFDQPRIAMRRGGRRRRNVYDLRLRESSREGWSSHSEGEGEAASDVNDSLRDEAEDSEVDEGWEGEAGEAAQQDSAMACTQLLGINGPVKPNPDDVEIEACGLGVPHNIFMASAGTKDWRARHFRPKEESSLTVTLSHLFLFAIDGPPQYLTGLTLLPRHAYLTDGEPLERAWALCTTAQDLQVGERSAGLDWLFESASANMGTAGASDDNSDSDDDSDDDIPPLMSPEDSNGPPPTGFQRSEDYEALPAHAFANVKAFRGSFQLGEPYANHDYQIPKMHHYAHRAACLSTAYDVTCSSRTHLGDGEGIERLWEYAAQDTRTRDAARARHMLESLKMHRRGAVPRRPLYMSSLSNNRPIVANTSCDRMYSNYKSDNRLPSSMPSSLPSCSGFCLPRRPPSIIPGLITSDSLLVGLSAMLGNEGTSLDKLSFARGRFDQGMSTYLALYAASAFLLRSAVSPVSSSLFLARSLDRDRQGSSCKNDVGVPSHPNPSFFSKLVLVSEAGSVGNVEDGVRALTSSDICERLPGAQPLRRQMGSPRLWMVWPAEP
ncbi:hypothetical protein C8R47DRAFT_1070983 [Mycena vitilis]|nr:hypothetical protein C8R47DRAFT_1070983 [Mycena vitilis]